MNNSTKNILFFIAGGIVGALVTKILLQEKYTNLAEEEIASVREVYNDKIERRASNVFELNKRPLSEVAREKNLTGYGDIAHRYNGGDDFPHEDDFEVDGSPDVTVEGRPYHPGDLVYMVSLEEFSEGTFNHDQETLRYYAEDDVLLDENESMITDVVAYVDDALLEFSKPDVHVVYVRNERLGVDYEIVLALGSYQEQVLGIPYDKIHGHN